MHHHRIDRGLLQQHDVARERLGEIFRAHGMAAIFDDDGFLVILLHVGQRLGQDAGLIERTDIGRVGHEAGLGVRSRTGSIRLAAHGAKRQPRSPRRGHAAATASVSQLTISSVPPVGGGKRKQAVAGKVPQGQIAGEQRCRDDKAEGGGKSDPWHE